jgi:hypothetical protein
MEWHEIPLHLGHIPACVLLAVAAGDISLHSPTAVQIVRGLWVQSFCTLLWKLYRAEGTYSFKDMRKKMSDVSRSLRRRKFIQVTFRRKDYHIHSGASEKNNASCEYGMLRHVVWYKLMRWLLSPTSSPWCILDKYWFVGLLKKITLWDIAPCILVEVDRRFIGAYCLHHHSSNCPQSH